MSESFVDRASFNCDTTWPDPLPSETAIQDVFFNELSRPSSWSPQDHLQRVRGIVFSGETFTSITRSLHDTLTVRGYYNDSRLSGRNVMRGSQETAPLIKHTGIDRHVDLRKGVLPGLRPLLAQVIGSNQDPQVKLDTMAVTMGTVIAESQSFSDGNTRIARTVHDYIKGGLDAISLEKVVDASRDFTPPKDIEELIMMQNLTQLVEHPEGNPNEDAGIMAVSDKAIDYYLDASSTLQELWQLDGLFGDYEWEQELSYDDKIKRRAEMMARIEQVLSREDEDLFLKTQAVLLQKHYAPAAVAATTFGRPLSLPLNTPRMSRLVETNVELMKMRVRSLGVGMARRGLFMTIEQDDMGKQSRIGERFWRPDV